MRSITSRLCHDIFNSAKMGYGENPYILAEEEKKLLMESLPSGRFDVFESDCFGSHLVTEEKHWFSEKDEFYQELVLDAFSLLCKRGYIRHEKLHLFKLSRQGFEAAYHLVDNSQQEACEIDAA